MGNPHRGDLDVEVGGKTYVICYDLNACAVMMKALGLNSMEQLTEDGGVMSGLDFTALIKVLWAGFNRHHPDMSLEDVGALEWDMEVIGEVLQEGIQRGLVRKDSPPLEKTKRQDGLGTGRQRRGRATKRA